jgi:hypothetical protein
LISFFGWILAGDCVDFVFACAGCVEVVFCGLGLLDGCGDDVGLGLLFVVWVVVGLVIGLLVVGVLVELVGLDPVRVVVGFGVRLVGFGANEVLCEVVTGFLGEAVLDGLRSLSPPSETRPTLVPDDGFLSVIQKRCCLKLTKFFLQIIVVFIITNENFFTSVKRGGWNCDLLARWPDSNIHNISQGISPVN